MVQALGPNLSQNEYKLLDTGYHPPSQFSALFPCIRLSFLQPGRLPSSVSQTSLQRCRQSPPGPCGFIAESPAAHQWRAVKSPLTHCWLFIFYQEKQFVSLICHTLPCSYVCEFVYVCVCLYTGMHTSWLLKEFSKYRPRTPSLVPVILTHLEGPLSLSEWFLQCTMEF